MLSLRSLRSAIAPAVIGIGLMTPLDAQAFYWFNWPGSTGGSFQLPFPNAGSRTRARQQRQQQTVTQPTNPVVVDETPDDDPETPPNTGVGDPGDTPEVPEAPGVPEPATIVGGLIGLGALGLLRRRRKRA